MKYCGNLGKALSLILITLFGAGTAVVHILDQSESKILDNTGVQSSYSSKPDIEVQTYRKQLRNSYNLEDTQSNAGISGKNKSLWSGPHYTQDIRLNSNLRPEILEISKNNSFEQLNNEKKFWYSQYNILIKQKNNKQAAKDAYNKYRKYKEAINIKRAYNR